MAGLLIGLIVFVIMLVAGFSLFFKSLPVQNFDLGSAKQSQNENSESGITGKILAGPQCPVEKVGEDCEDKPYQATVVVKTIDGREVTKFSSDASSNFKISLSPGRYWLEGVGGQKFPGLSQMPIEVLPNQFKEMTLRFDTGIR